MHFSRYEIRHYFTSEEYGENYNFSYIPFDTLTELEKYLKEHQKLKESDDHFICFATYYPNHENVDKLCSTKVYFNLHEKGIIH